MIAKMMAMLLLACAVQTNDPPTGSPPPIDSVEKRTLQARGSVKELRDARVAAEAANKIPNECEDRSGPATEDCGRKTCRDCRRWKAVKDKATKKAAIQLEKAVAEINATLANWEPLPESKASLSPMKYAALFNRDYCTFSVTKPGYYRALAKADDGLSCDASILDDIGMQIVDLGSGIAWLEPETRYQLYAFQCTKTFSATVEPLASSPQDPLAIDPQAIPPLRIRDR